jgi:hypothetical protein
MTNVHLHVRALVLSAAEILTLASVNEELQAGGCLLVGVRGRRLRLGIWFFARPISP